MDTYKTIFRIGEIRDPHGIRLDDDYHAYETPKVEEAVRQFMEDLPEARGRKKIMIDIEWFEVKVIS